MEKSGVDVDAREREDAAPLSTTALHPPILYVFLSFAPPLLLLRPFFCSTSLFLSFSLSLSFYLSCAVFILTLSAPSALSFSFLFLCTFFHFFCSLRLSSVLEQSPYMRGSQLPICATRCMRNSSPEISELQI